MKKSLPEHMKQILMVQKLQQEYISLNYRQVYLKKLKK